MARPHNVWIAGTRPTTTSTVVATVIDATVITTHNVTLFGLSPWTRYSYRVRSVDAAGNATTSPNYSFRTAQ